MGCPTRLKGKALRIKELRVAGHMLSGMQLVVPQLGQ